MSLVKALRCIRKGELAKGSCLLGEVINTGSPDALEALAHRAWLHRSLGDYEDAIKDYQVYLAKRPEDAEARGFFAQTLLAVSEENAEQAFYEALEALKADRRSVSAWRALATYQELLRLEEEHPQSHQPSEEPGIFLNSVVQELEREAEVVRTSVFPEVGRLIYALVRVIQPKVVLETGTFAGYSSLCITQALEDNGKGHLHCFDLFGKPYTNYSSPVLGTRETLLQYARGHLEKAGLAHRATLHSGDSSKNIQKIFKECQPIVDFAFIDGDHSTEGCFKDWNAIAPLLKKEALVLLHDTKANGSAWIGPGLLLERLESETSNNYRWINIPTFEKLGLGCVQKIDAQSMQNWRPNFSELAFEWLFKAAGRGWKG